MSLRPSIALLALLLLAASGALWFALSGSPTGAPEPPLSAPAESQSTTPEGLELGLPPERSRGAEAGAKPAAGGEREAVVTAESDSGGFAIPGDALWIEGRVIFPGATPLDEEVRVVASGRPFTKDRKASRKHSVPVESDGRFRVAFGKGTRKGFLALEGRYLFLEGKQRVEPATQAGEVVLEPQLGGVIVATVVPPLGVDVSEELLSSVAVTTWAARGGWSHGLRRRDGCFELTGLPPDDGYELELTSSRFANEKRKRIAVLPGEVTEVELALRRGVRLAGRVVGADGEGLPGIELAFSARVRVGASGYSTSVDRRTGQDGEFDLRGLLPAKYTLRIRAEGYVGVTEELGELEDGAVRENLLFQLRTGLALEGRVLWPDGSPAGGASVTVRQVRESESYIWAQRDHRGAADSNGEFRVTGLGAEAVMVSASARRELAIRDEGAGAGGAGGKARGRGPRWTRGRTDVPPGTEGLILVLAPGETLRGRVVDDRGAPVPRFSVLADRVSKVSSPLAENRVRTRFKRENGEFELGGLEPGEWWVQADGAGFLESSRTRVAIPADAPVELRVTRASRLAGTVSTPDGASVSGARVELSGWDGTNPNTARSVATTTDGQGRFEAKEAPTARVTLVASAPGWAPSSPLALEVAPGEELERLVLVLRRGARLTGEVHSAAAPIAGRAVRVRENAGARSWPKARTDEAGRFAFGDLPPGSFTVQLDPPATEPREVDWAIRVARTRKVDVELLEGASAHVVLGGPLANAIRVHGLVNAEGKGTAGLVLRCERDGFFTAARCDEAGGYELEVAGPGSYIFSIGVGDYRSVSFEREIGAGSFRREDFDLPSGSLSGVLIGPGGEPVPWTCVSAELLEAEDGGCFGSEETDSDEVGRFRLDLLHPGRYLLRAGGPGYDGEEECLAITLIDGVVLGAGEEREGLRVELRPGGAIAGRVTRADGTPVEEAWMQVRDGKGRELHVPELHSSGEGGDYLCPGIPAGTFTVSAITDERATLEVEVEISAGSTSRVDLVFPD